MRPKIKAVGRTPLLDLSDGRMKGWPGGSMTDEHGEVFTFYHAKTDTALDGGHAEVRRGGFGRWIYCKYCFPDRMVLPLALHEFVPGYGHSRMAICSRCGSGLTPTEDVSDARKGRIRGGAH